MKQLILLLLLLCSATYAQNKIQGSVFSGDKQPVPYCAVGLKNSTLGTLTNEQGVFQIGIRNLTDTLVFYCTGYKKREITALELQRNSNVKLESQGIELLEVPIFGTDERAYAILSKCREALNASSRQRSKGYFLLESYVGDQPVEVLECFYNATFNDRAVADLQFKNGRVALAPFGNRYFINKNTSKAFTSFNLIAEHDRLPLCPLQLNPRQLKKKFNAGLVTPFDSPDSVFVVHFSPKTKSIAGFKGKAWISKKTYKLLQISMDIEDTQRHPFLPLFASHGKIHSVSIHFNKSFSEDARPQHIDFNYDIKYEHWRDPSNKSAGDSMFTASCKGLLYFFDYGKLYIPPYFTYDDNASDYRKINLLTYNENFWLYQPAPVFSDSVKKALLYLRKKGSLFGFKSERSVNAFFPKEELFEVSYPVWSYKKRLVLNDLQKRTETQPKKYVEKEFNADKYHLKAQIFLDVTIFGDSVQHVSKTVLDDQETYYNLKEEDNTNAFLNIFFDLHEIERRKMEKAIVGKKLNALQIDSLYKATETRLAKETDAFQREVNHGKNEKELKRYNELVIQQLGIDNLELFQKGTKINVSKP